MCIRDSLWLCNSAISMTSLIGFLMLVGTVVNAGILYVDTVNQYRETMDKETALIEAGATRMRPILMTTLTTIISMIPMALAFGSSGKTTQGLALVNIGGLTASTILSLLMLPIFYSIIDNMRLEKHTLDDCLLYTSGFSSRRRILCISGALYSDGRAVCG